MWLIDFVLSLIDPRAWKASYMVGRRQPGAFDRTDALDHQRWEKDAADGERDDDASAQRAPPRNR